MRNVVIVDVDRTGSGKLGGSKYSLHASCRGDGLGVNTTIKRLCR